MEVTKVVDATRDFKIGELETHALRGVNLSIKSGEFTALVGPSGSGKTTLLQLIGLLDQPTSGTVFINGKDVTGLNRNQRADMRKGSIGFIFQFFALIPDGLRECGNALAVKWNQTGRATRTRNGNAGSGQPDRPCPPSSRSIERRTATAGGGGAGVVHAPFLRAGG